MVRDIAPASRPFLLSPAQLRRSLHVDAPELAMARVWRKLESGQPLRLGLIGSSVGMSGGCQAEHQPHLRCAQFDGKQTHKFFARGYGVEGVSVKTAVDLRMALAESFRTPGPFLIEACIQ